MFIIVEGPDGAGKTTLIEKLRQQFNNQFSNCEVIHFGKIDDPSKYFDIYMQAIAEQYESMIDVTILDRCWYSDRVYGPIMRNKEEMSKEKARRLDQAVVESGGGMIIYCDAPTHVLWTRCRKRGETYITKPEQIIAIAELYKEEMKESLLPVIYYNTAEGF